jgi:FtsH-binding integral membrane protein
MTDTNIASIGPQIVDSAFSGSYELMGLGLFLLFAVMLWKSNAPLSTSLVIGLGLCYALSVMGIPVFGVLFWGGVMVLGVYLALTIFNYAKQ